VPTSQSNYADVAKYEDTVYQHNRKSRIQALASSVISILKKISISILIPFFPIISFQFLISISQKILISILIPLFDCNSYFNS